MSIPSIVAMLSAAVCAQLISAGFVASTLTITDATNTAPIVITTQQNHLLLDGAVVEVSGVGGNTAANDFWNITKISDKEFSLDNSTGNAAYTTGGSAKAALVSGKILLGRQWVRQNQATPRIIVIPVGGDMPPRDQYATANVPGQTEAQRQAALAPSVLTHRNLFEVQVWGSAPTASAASEKVDDAYTTCEFMRDMVLRVCDQQYRGNFTAAKGSWDDQKVTATQDMKLGHVYSFQLTIDAPVTVTPKEFAPAGVSATVGVYFIPADGSPPGELAATIET